MIKTSLRLSDDLADKIRKVRGKFTYSEYIIKLLKDIFLDSTSIDGIKQIAYGTVKDPIEELPTPKEELPKEDPEVEKVVVGIIRMFCYHCGGVKGFRDGKCINCGGEME